MKYILLLVFPALCSSFYAIAQYRGGSNDGSHWLQLKGIQHPLPGIYSGGIQQGSKVEISFGDGRTTSATVDFVQPFFAEAQEFLKVRVYTRETEGLPVGRLVNATLHLDATEGLWVPREAVLDIGLKKVVFLKDRGIFKPKEVLTGSKAAGMVEIVKGLASSDEIAANAHFMVDSEGFVDVAN